MEPFKNKFNNKLISGIAGHLAKADKTFDQKGFEKKAKKNLSKLELKERSQQITDSLLTFLPADFKKAGKIILAILGPPIKEDLSGGEITQAGIAGWAIMPFARYVAIKGKGHFDLSMELLCQLTRRFSAEFDIRYFLMENPEKTMKVVKKWAKNQDVHIRRLASEGCRPRLPWGVRLQVFVEDPAAVLEVLEVLKDDKSEYVRRSVANNLNDISKDHPDLVAKVAARWLEGASKERKRLVRHGCRTLIKAGHKKTLLAFGYKKARLKIAKVKVETKKVRLGGDLAFSFTLESLSNKVQPLILDYVVHFRKKNGELSPKVFKWKVMDLLAGEKVTLVKRHGVKKVTTRTYYEGAHFLQVMVNGEVLGREGFTLLV